MPFVPRNMVIKERLFQYNPCLSNDFEGIFSLRNVVSVKRVSSGTRMWPGGVHCPG